MQKILKYHLRCANHASANTRASCISFGGVIMASAAFFSAKRLRSHHPLLIRFVLKYFDIVLQKFMAQIKCGALKIYKKSQQKLAF